MFLYVFFIFYTCTETFITVGVYLKYSNELLSLVINLCFGWPLVDIMLLISSKSVNIRSFMKTIYSMFSMAPSDIRFVYFWLSNKCY